MTNIIMPLDLQTILVTVFSGNWQIFIFLAIIALSALAARLRMPNNVFVLMLVLFTVMFANIVGGLYALVILIIGLICYWAISRIVKY